ncbi:unnamed protein product [Chrysodeixis includens]|uniref:Uncharacterized protein n=1 Tax=Chrysodeixis includens TaxID=689277 RepID=A0A9N8KWV6_CHRIL|nr:unnamed protein product [Chrysodeixis includens]
MSFTCGVSARWEPSQLPGRALRPHRTAPHRIAPHRAAPRRRVFPPRCSRPMHMYCTDKSYWLCRRHGAARHSTARRGRVRGERGAARGGSGRIIRASASCILMCLIVAERAGAVRCGAERRELCRESARIIIIETGLWERAAPKSLMLLLLQQAAPSSAS